MASAAQITTMSTLEANRDRTQITFWGLEHASSAAKEQLAGGPPRARAGRRRRIDNINGRGAASWAHGRSSAGLWRAICASGSGRGARACRGWSKCRHREDRERNAAKKERVRALWIASWGCGLPGGTDVCPTSSRWLDADAGGVGEKEHKRVRARRRLPSSRQDQRACRSSERR